MKKTVFIRLLAFAAAVLVLTASLLCLPASATVDTDRLVDKADILTDEQEKNLRSRLNTVSEKYGLDVVIVTTDTLNGKWIRDYADDWQEGYGKDGILLVRYVSGTDKDVWISTMGKGIRYLSDADIDYVFDCMEPYCRSGNDALAFYTFIDETENCIVTYESFDTTWILIGLVVGLVVALIVTGSMKKKLKTVRPQPFAGNYVRPGSFNLTVRRDTYLYSTVSRVRRERESSGGGSSTHRSSSGTSHGGGGRHM